MNMSSQDGRGAVTANHRLRLALSLVLLVAVGCAVYWGGLFHRMPSDSALRNGFFQNEADFVKLIEMSNQDAHVTLIRRNVTYLDTDMSWPRKDIGFSEDRWNEYRRMFHKLNIDGGVTRRTDYPLSVFINVYASGGVLGSADKGYVYSESPLAPVVESLAVMPRDLYNRNKGHAIIFERLTTNWYLFREEF